jgi:hypothetical protein
MLQSLATAQITPLKNGKIQCHSTCVVHDKQGDSINTYEIKATVVNYKANAQLLQLTASCSSNPEKNGPDGKAINLEFSSVSSRIPLLSKGNLSAATATKQRNRANVCDAQTAQSLVRKDILKEFRTQAMAKSRVGADAHTVRANQTAWIDRSTGKGQLSSTLWPHDKVIWDKIPDIKKHPVNVMLPGYAVGDRYSAILTMLVYPKMKLTIAYSEDFPVLPKEKDYALEAHEIIKKALQKFGLSEDSINTRLSIVQHNGSGPLNSISGSFNDPTHRVAFKQVNGAPSALCQPASDESHVFHISATTVMMAKHWEDTNDSARSAEEIRTAVYSLVAPEAKASLDKLVRQTIKETGLEKEAVLLWTTNKPFQVPIRNAASARQKEAFANPQMLELIQQKMQSSGHPVAYIADGFKNIYSDRVEDRHPWQDQSIPNIGKFWEKSPLLLERVNQWYFIDQLMKKADVKALVGVRSGALEPISLLGHNVVYLEHKNMFTPERHAPWQGRIPYNRLVTELKTGYTDNDTEVERSRLRRDIISNNIMAKSKRDADDAVLIGLIPADIKDQSRYAEMDESIQAGVLSTAELELLEKMVVTGKPAHDLVGGGSTGGV